MALNGVAGLEEQHKKKKGIIQRVIEKHSLYSLRPKRTLVNSFLGCKITKKYRKSTDFGYFCSELSTFQEIMCNFAE